jgi:hypothetical protein
MMMSNHETRALFISKDMARIQAHFTPANVNVVNERGLLALHMACSYSTPDSRAVVAHLLDCWCAC